MSLSIDQKKKRNKTYSSFNYWSVLSVSPCSNAVFFLLILTCVFLSAKTFRLNKNVYIINRLIFNLHLQCGVHSRMIRFRLLRKMMKSSQRGMSHKKLVMWVLASKWAAVLWLFLFFCSYYRQPRGISSLLLPPTGENHT